MSDIAYPGLPDHPPFNPEGWRVVMQAIRRMLSGGMNIVTDLTLTANVASTTLTDPRITANSFIGLMPKTANAAAEIGAGTLYFATPGNESVVVNHANNAQTDRTYRVLILG